MACDDEAAFRQEGVEQGGKELAAPDVPEGAEWELLAAGSKPEERALTADEEFEAECEALEEEGYYDSPAYKERQAQAKQEVLDRIAEAVVTPPDMVNSPPHYNTAEIEAIDVMRAALGEVWFEGYCLGCVLKYTLRAGYKGEAAQDLAKARWYLRMATGDDPREDMRTGGA